jgi:hypothetical protein
MLIGVLIYISIILPCSCFEDKPVQNRLAVSPTGLKVIYLESSNSPDSGYVKKWSGTINIFIRGFGVSVLIVQAQ